MDNWYDKRTDNRLDNWADNQGITKRITGQIARRIWDKENDVKEKKMCLFKRRER